MKTGSLVLTRRPSESIQFDVDSPDGSRTSFSVTIEGLNNNGAVSRLRIDAPLNVSITRSELLSSNEEAFNKN